MKLFLRNNGLSLTLLVFFVMLLGGQAWSGFQVHNLDQQTHHQAVSSFGEYVSSPHFFEATFENWESEFLQMAAYVLFTVFLYQKGSAESKDPEKLEEVDEDPLLHRDDPDAPAPVGRGGWRLKLYENSLFLALFALFLVSWLGHAVAGAAHFNDEQSEHGQPPVSLIQYLGSSRFWFESFQNWQSEFLAVAAIVVLSIWLRQKGSPESKPVATPHHVTGG